MYRNCSATCVIQLNFSLLSHPNTVHRCACLVHSEPQCSESHWVLSPQGHPQLNRIPLLQRKKHKATKQSVPIGHSSKLCKKLNVPVMFRERGKERGREGGREGRRDGEKRESSQAGREGEDLKIKKTSPQQQKQYTH